MGKYERKKKRRFPLWILLVLLLCAAAAAVVIFGRDFLPAEIDPTRESTAETRETAPMETETTPAQTLQILSSREEGAWVLVDTTYVSVRYPFAFSDLIRVEPENGGTERLIFRVQIGSTTFDMFAVCFDDSGIIDLGTVSLPGGEIRPLTAEVYPVPDTLDADGRNTYLAAQESFNDVVASLGENENVALAN